MDNTEPKKLYRSSKDRMISGVCGGMADYFNIDPTIVRIIWVLLFFTGGTGLLLYIAALIIVPLDPESEPVKREPGGDSKAIWGIILVVIGIVLIIGRYG
ncbi:MAG: PspC domain-containing protein, partial [FCB group bacterium]|nr:PspC domain-containing protein [FCB group bacterium]